MVFRVSGLECSSRVAGFRLIVLNDFGIQCMDGSKNVDRGLLYRGVTI